MGFHVRIQGPQESSCDDVTFVRLSPIEPLFSVTSATKITRQFANLESEPIGKAGASREDAAAANTRKRTALRTFIEELRSMLGHRLQILLSPLLRTRLVW